jgi:hypothetical protein
MKSQVHQSTCFLPFQMNCCQIYCAVLMAFAVHGVCRAFSLEFELCIVVTFDIGLSKHAVHTEANASKQVVCNVF